VLRERGEIDERYRWNLQSIFPDWAAWSSAYAELERKIDEFAALRGSLARGGTHLLAALELRDLIGRLSYKVWYFASLWYDQDQRDNSINAQRQQVQILFAKSAQASSWFDPELLAIPLATVQVWLAESSSLAVYRFAVEDLYRQQEHVLDENGERLLSFSSRFSSAPTDAYSSLTTAELRLVPLLQTHLTFPQIGERQQLSRHGGFPSIQRRQFPGFGQGPPVAQSSSSIVCTTGTALPRCSWVMQPILPVAIKSGFTLAMFLSLRSRNWPASSGWSRL